LPAAVILAPAAGAADEPTAGEIGRKMMAALYPTRPSTRTIDIEVGTDKGTHVSWTARQARTGVAGERYNLTVVVAPDSVAGFAILAGEADSAQRSSLWIYVPPVRRVKQVHYEGRLDNFLNTDMSVEDFGFLHLADGELEMVGKSGLEGEPAYLLRQTPKGPSAFSRIMTWVAAETFLPLRREFYDAAGALWKTQTFGESTVINGIPTPLSVTMKDEQQGGYTRLQVREVSYTARLAPEIFRVEALATALDSAKW
jgi:outer membrane lipoprotein-sorting protein